MQFLKCKCLMILNLSDKGSRLLFFCDIDDSLMTSRRKTKAGRRYLEAAINSREEPCSFFSEQHLLLIDLIQRSANFFIPVTGRSSSSLARVNIRFNSYVIASHGAVILTPDLKLSESWRHSIETDITAWQPELLTLYSRLEAVLPQTLRDSRISLVWDKGIASYISVKGKPERLNELLENLDFDLQSLPFQTHLNDRNLAILPPYASKARALTFLFDEMGLCDTDLTIALGDSLSDLEFMGLCDMSMCPADSQIQRRLQRIFRGRQHGVG